MRVKAFTAAALLCLAITASPIEKKKPDIVGPQLVCTMKQVQDTDGISWVVFGDREANNVIVWHKYLGTVRGDHKDKAWKICKSFLERGK